MGRASRGRGREQAQLATTSLGALTPLATEQHFSVSEVAGMWGVSRDMVTREFKDRDGVLKFRRSGSLAGSRKREYVTLRIPLSVLVRFHQDRTTCWQREIELRSRRIED